MSFLGNSAAAAARGGSGPMNVLLSSPAAQWVTLGGLGAYVVSPETVQATLQRALQSVAQNTNSSSNSLIDYSNHSDVRSSSGSVPSSIIIHTGSDGSKHSGSGSGSSSVVTTLITYTIAAGCVWVTYTVLSHALPEYVSNLLPVTRQVFDQTSKNLATSICNLKDIVALQIQKIMKKQDTLGRKQDDMHRDVQSMQDDVSMVRTDIMSILESVERCDATVEASQHLQSYTARGVKLLVSAVGAVLPETGNHALLRELEQYAHDGTVFRHQLERTNSNHHAAEHNRMALSGYTPSAGAATSSTHPSMALTTTTAMTTPGSEPPENEHPHNGRYSPPVPHHLQQSSHHHHYQEQQQQHHYPMKHSAVSEPQRHYGSSQFGKAPVQQPQPTAANHSDYVDRGDYCLSRIRAGELLVPHVA